MRGKIILSSQGTVGDLTPFIRLGAALVERGHGVTLVSNAVFRPQAAAAGLEFHAVDSPEDYEAFMGDTALFNEPGGYVELYRRHFLPRVPREFAVLSALAANAENPVIVARSAPLLAPLLLGEKTGIRVVAAFLAPSFLTTMPLLGELFQGVLGGQLNEMRRQCGLGPVADWRGWFAGVHSGVALWPEWFSASASSLPFPVDFTGFALAPLGRSRMDDALEAVLGSRPILLTLGTGLFAAPELFQKALEAALRTGRQVLVVAAQRKLVPHPLPDGVTLATSVPFELIGSRLSAAIHHGGIGTTAQMLQAGVPQLILPFGADRPENAHCVKRLGAGGFLPPNRWTVDQIKLGLDELLTEPAGMRCARIANLIGEEAWAAKSCAAVERAFASGHARRRGPDAAVDAPELAGPPREKIAGDVAGPVRASQPPVGLGGGAGRTPRRTASAEAMEKLARLSPEKRAWIEEKLRGRAQRAAVEIPRLARSGLIQSFPASYAQERLWFLQWLSPGLNAYNVSSAGRVRGELRLREFLRAIEGVVLRHESLRTTFQRDGATLLQVVRPGPGASCRIADLSSLDPSAGAAESARLIRADALRPFDLGVDAPVRVLLCLLSPTERHIVYTLHHCVCDAWSLRVLIRDVSVLYEAFSTNRPALLPELPVQYADYAAWQREWMKGPAHDLQLLYWRDGLADAPVLDLPLDRPRPAGPGRRGAVETFLLDTRLRRGLEEAGRRESATLFMVLLAAYNALLSRHAGQQGILVGIPITNRSRQELEHLVGFLVNTLVVRVELREGMEFHEVLGETRRASVEAFANQDLPFEELVQDLRPDRRPDVNPLFQTAFSLVNTPGRGLGVAGLEFEPFQVPVLTPKFDLMLTLVESESGLAGAFEYCADLFERSTIIELSREYCSLLERVAGGARGPMWPPLPAGDECDSDRVASADAGRECVGEWFEAAAAAVPDSIAVVEEGGHLSYRELLRRAGRVAGELSERGVRPETCVAIGLTRSINLVVAVMGVLRSGACFLALPLDCPRERLGFMLADAGARFLLADRESPSSFLDQDRVPGLMMEHLLDGGPGGAPLPRLRPLGSSLAYMIYTSGSSGRPKAVQVEHRQLVSYIGGIVARMDFAAAEHFLYANTPAADLGFTTFFPSLCVGGCLHLVPEDRTLDSDWLVGYLKNHAVDHLKVTPSQFAVMTRASAAAPLLRKNLILGGEGLREEWASSLKLAPARVHNHYGPTETTVGVLTRPLDGPNAASPNGLVPLGVPLPGARVFVVGRRLDLLPRGVRGEMVIAGRCVARGYLHRPDLTAERFCPDSLSGATGARIYRTGDVGRRNRFGEFEYVRRDDGQVKIRGFRVELGEVESAVKDCPGVREAAVLVEEDPAGLGQLTAYVVPREEPGSGSDARIELPGGLRVCCLNKSEARYLHREIFELQAYMRHGITLRDGDVVFDVGANIGLFSLFASLACQPSRVFAFEPNPAAHRLLRLNLAPFAATVEARSEALSDRTGEAALTVFAGFSFFSGFYTDAAREREVVRQFIANQSLGGDSEARELMGHADEILDGRFDTSQVAVQLRTLSGFIDEREVPRVDLLKINVEKSEVDVLAGIRPEHWGRIRQIVLETDEMANRERILTLLARQGFDVRAEQDTLLERTELSYVYAVNRAHGLRLHSGNTARIPVRTTSREGSAGGVSELRRFLSAKLPPHMVPASYVVLAAMPLTANGKIDRRALRRNLGGELDAPRCQVPPQTANEVLLAGIWAEVLRLPRVGVEDNFFELGGDSILSIQVVTRAREAGLMLRPRDLFEQQTIARLARLACPKPPAAPENPVPGPIGLTPVQCWFFEQSIVPVHQFNQAVILKTAAWVGAEEMERSVREVLRRHDAFRHRFRQVDGTWLQVLAGEDASRSYFRADLSGLPAETRTRACRDLIVQCHQSLDIGRGPLARVAWIELGVDNSPRLLMVAHHLIMDGVSFRVLLEDLRRALESLRLGHPIDLGPKSSSYGQWSARLREYAAGPSLGLEREYWRTAAGAAFDTLAMDWPSDENTVGNAETLGGWLTEAETERLLTESASRLRSSPQEILLAALARALAEGMGLRRVRIDLEGHGREELFDDLDLSRAVGWFTSIYPVTIEVGGGGALELLKRVKGLLRSVPGRGIGYGLLRFARPDLWAGLESGGKSEICFNYLGRLDQALARQGPFEPVDEDSGPAVGGGTRRSHMLEVSAFVGGGRMGVRLRYGRGQFRPSTIKRISGLIFETLRTCLECGGEDSAAALSPVDFPLADVGEPELADVLRRCPRLENLCALSPVQEGLLFHTLHAPGGGIGFEQFSCPIEGDLEVEAFRRTWSLLFERHAILRTCFLWRRVSRPLQVVQREVEFVWGQEDLRGMTMAAQQERVAGFLAGDLKAGFDPEDAPLMRFALFILADSRHLFVWSFHHLVLDGWSLPVLLRDAFGCYDQIRSGTPVRLPVPRPFQDYVAWLRDQDAGASERFWRARFEGLRTGTSIVRVLSAGEREQGKGESSIILDESFAERLSRFCRARRITINTAFYAAWSLVLAEYAGVEDVVFGVTVSGRPAELSGVEQMVGVFINTLPMRVRICPDQPLQEFLGQVQRDQAEMREFSHSPLVDIQAWSGLPRGTTLFDCILICENYPIDPSVLERPDIRLGRVRRAKRTNYPLAVGIFLGREISIEFDYDRSAFGSNVISNLADSLRDMLRQFMEGAGALRDYEVLTPRQRRALLPESEAPVEPSQPCGCLHEMFEATADRFPDAVSLECEGSHLSFGGLERRANQLARHLAGIGVGRDAVVATAMERSLEMVVAIVAVWKAGAAFLPVDLDLPLARIEFILQDAGAFVLLTHDGVDDKLPRTQGIVICVDRDWEAIQSRDSVRAARLSDPRDLAYVIYTSGSKGRPKGVGCEHHGVCNMVREKAALFRVEPGFRMFQTAAIGFDVSVAEIALSLTAGLTLVLPGRRQVLPGLEFAETLVRERINIIMLPHAILSRLPRLPMPDLKVVCTGGEACAPDVVGRWAPGRRFFNAYGATETCVTVTAAECAGSGGRAFIGGALGNVGVFVVSSSLRLRPLLTKGEILVGGAAVARGYINDPALTAERFVPDPFTPSRGARAYRTGDLGSWVGAGMLDFAGRLDDQVKLRGFRVELGELESILRESPAVADVVARVVDAGSGDPRLIAYAILKKEAESSSADLLEFLSGRAPKFLMPSSVICLESFPLTINGKVDRDGLPLLPPQDGEQDEAPPLTDTEARLLRLWREVLRTESVGREADFFSSGGHSLLATQLVSRIRDEFGRELPLERLFAHPRLMDLAGALDALPPCDPPVVPDDLSRVREMSEEELDAEIDRRLKQRGQPAT